MDIWKELEAEGVNRHLLAEVRSFRDAHGVAEEVRGRIPNPRFVYYGKDVWEAAAAAVLCGPLLRDMHRGKIHRLVFAGTGAMMSPTSVQQGQPIAGICHAVVLERSEA